MRVMWWTRFSRSKSVGISIKIYACNEIILGLRSPFFASLSDFFTPFKGGTRYKRARHLKNIDKGGGRNVKPNSLCLLDPVKQFDPLLTKPIIFSFWRLYGQQNTQLIYLNFLKRTVYILYLIYFNYLITYLTYVESNLCGDHIV